VVRTENSDILLEPREHGLTDTNRRVGGRLSTRRRGRRAEQRLIPTVILLGRWYDTKRLQGFVAGDGEQVLVARRGQTKDVAKNGRKCEPHGHYLFSAAKSSRVMDVGRSCRSATSLMATQTFPAHMAPRTDPAPERGFIVASTRSGG
jgi:hypothetical protein